MNRIGKQVPPLREFIVFISSSRRKLYIRNVCKSQFKARGYFRLLMIIARLVVRLFVKPFLFAFKQLAQPRMGLLVPDRKAQTPANAT